MFCENLVTVDIINTGRAKNPWAQSCLRELCWEMARANAVVKVVFRPGVSNRIADSLSRWDLGPEHKRQFFRSTRGVEKVETKITESDFEFSHEW